MLTINHVARLEFDKGYKHGQDRLERRSALFTWIDFGLSWYVNGYLYGRFHASLNLRDSDAAYNQAVDKTRKDDYILPSLRGQFGRELVDRWQHRTCPNCTGASGDFCFDCNKIDYYAESLGNEYDRKKEGV